MQETGIDYVHSYDEPVTFSTNRGYERDAIRARLEKYGHEYQENSYYDSDGDWLSTLFTVPRDSIRRPHKLIKTAK